MVYSAIVESVPISKYDCDKLVTFRYVYLTTCELCLVHIPSTMPLQSAFFSILVKSYNYRVITVRWPWGHLTMFFWHSRNLRRPLVPSGVISEYVNPYIPTHTSEEYWSDHMQTPGWQPTSCVAWCLIWLPGVCKFRKNCPTWHWMSLLRPGVINNHSTVWGPIEPRRTISMHCAKTISITFLRFYDFVRLCIEGLLHVSRVITDI